MDIIRQKVVKIRKDRQCFTCLRTLKKGSSMIFSVIKDGDLYSSYMCEDCNKVMELLGLTSCKYGEMIDICEYEGGVKSPAELLEVLKHDKL